MHRATHVCFWPHHALHGGGAAPLLDGVVSAMVQLRAPHTSACEVSTTAVLRLGVIGQLASDSGCPALVLGEWTSTSSGVVVRVGQKLALNRGLHRSLSSCKQSGAQWQQPLAW